MTANLKQKTIKGVFWNSVSTFSVQGMSFIFGIILARILSTADYGIIGMINIFMAVSTAFVNSGFSSALIRKTDRTEKDLSTTFYFNVVIGALAYVILFFSAPLIAAFFRMDILVPVVRVVAINVFINSLLIVQFALLSIRLDFKSRAFISLISTAISGIVGITLAYAGYGVWSLVFQGLSQSVLNAILLWSIVKWVPRERFSKSSFKSLFGFGSKLLASGLLDTIYNNIYSFVIGRRFSASQLGLYNRADGWGQLPAMTLTSVLQGVTYPVMSTIQDEEDRLRVNYSRMIGMAAYVIFPVMLWMTAVAAPLVNVVITDKWAACVPYLRILSVGLMLYPIHAINLNLLQVKGRSDLFLRLEIYKKILGVMLLIITIPMGIAAMCWGRLVHSYISLLINTYYSGKFFNMGIVFQIRSIIRPLIHSVVMCVLAYVTTLLIGSDLWALLGGSAVAFIYYVLSSVLFKSPEWQELMNIVKNRLK